MGAIIGGADDEQLAAADNYCRLIGLAFQITDDILDVTGDEKLLGKPTHSDEANEKSTYVSLYGLENAGKMADELFSQAMKELDRLPGDTQFLRDLTNMLAQRRS